MVMTAVAEEAKRDILNAKYAARIPPICRALPTAIESRAKTLRFVVAVGFSDLAFKPTSRASVPVNSTNGFGTISTRASKLKFLDTSRRRQLLQFGPR